MLFDLLPSAFCTSRHEKRRCPSDGFGVKPTCCWVSSTWCSNGDLGTPWVAASHLRKCSSSSEHLLFAAFPLSFFSLLASSFCYSFEAAVCDHWADPTSELFFLSFYFSSEVISGTEELRAFLTLFETVVTLTVFTSNHTLFKIQLYIFLNKLDASKITVNVFQIETSFIQVKLLTLQYG